MNLLDELPCAAFFSNTDGRLLTVNQGLVDLLGGNAAQWSGRSIDDMLPPAGRIFMQTHVWPTLLRDGHVDEIHLQVLDHRRARVPVLLNGRRAEHLQAPAFAWTLFVVHERHRFEAELVQARNRAENEAAERERLAALLQDRTAELEEAQRLGQIGNWYEHDDGDMRWSPAMRRIFGLPQEHAALPLAAQGELYGDADFVRLQAAADHARATGEGFTLQLATAAGSTRANASETSALAGPARWVEVRGEALREANAGSGRVVALRGTLQDITELRQRELDLRRASALLLRTGEVAGVGGWDLEVLTGVLSWSGHTRAIHAVADDYQPTLQAAINFFAPTARPLIEAAVQAAISSGTPWDLELPFVQASGGHIHVRASGSAEFERGQLVRLVGAYQDVTEQVQQRQALRAAHQRMALAADSGGIGVWDIDLMTQTLTVDAWVVRLYDLPPGFGSDPEELWSRRVHPADRAEVAAAVAAAVARQRSLELEFRVVWGDASVHHLKLSARLSRDDHGRATSMVGVCWDVSSLRLLAADLAQQHELLRVTLNSIGDAVITTDNKGVVTWLNPVAERMTGWLSDEAQGLPLTQVFHIVNEATRKPTENPVATCLQQGKVVGLAHHTLLISRDGAEYGVEDSAAPIRSPAGEVLGVVLVFHDVSEQRRLSGEMTYRATHDGLTGLVNRAEFELRLGRVLHRAHEDVNEHALLYIDLDQFKLVNDACGHAIGDQLLRQVSRLFIDCVRTRDTLARLGGDEFGIILEHCSVEQAHRVGQKICDRMDEFRFVHDGRRFRVGASIGLVPIDRRWVSKAALQQAADSSCYAAKEAGRNRVHVWLDTDAAMRARQFEVQWSTRLEEALDRGSFELFAQRILPLRAATPGVHAEVLLRLPQPDGSLALPGAFIPAAERFNLISRIDRWVLGRVVQWLKALPSLEAMGSISVNLSGQSVGDRAFHEWAVSLLAGCSGQLCQRLCFEVTETSAMTQLADAAMFIRAVRASGVKVALDDFGTGASSFGYLKSLPVDILKIDGQFVRDMLTDPLNDAAVRCFVDVARVVGVQTVAEYVDSPAVLARLREIGVDYAQGFLVHKPEPIAGLLLGPTVLAH